MNEPKKHHFLPQFYLENFKIVPTAGKYPHIVVTTKEANPRSFRAAIHDIGCISDYNTIDMRGKPPERSSIELALSKTEASQQELISTIIKSRTIPIERKGEVASLLALMHLRVPKFKRNIETSLMKAVESLGEMMLRHGKLPPLPDELAKLSPKGFSDIVTIEIDNWIILSYMYGSALGSHLADVIERMTISLIESPKGKEFITGDTPVVIYFPEYQGRKPYGVGFADKEIEITFPITPDLLLFASWQPSNRGTQIGLDLLNEFNRRTVIMADKYLYSRTEDKDTIKIISNNAAIEAGYKTDLVDGGEGMYLINRFVPVTDSD